MTAYSASMYSHKASCATEAHGQIARSSRCSSLARLGTLCHQLSPGLPGCQQRRVAPRPRTTAGAKPTRTSLCAVNTLRRARA
eukprot:4673986-Prymnesium_polylepis.1